MATFTPFMQGTKAQSIINDFLGGNLVTSPNVNTAGKFRNPKYDIRTEQEKAGTLDPTADFPNPQIFLLIATISSSRFSSQALSPVVATPFS